MPSCGPLLVLALTVRNIIGNHKPFFCTIFALERPRLCYGDSGLTSSSTLLVKDSGMMNAIIVSDLHIGSRYFLRHGFKSLIEQVPPDYELILNGDIIDNPKIRLPQPHQRIFDLIVSLSYRNRVVWVQGNHDHGFIPNEIGRIEESSDAVRRSW